MTTDEVAALHERTEGWPAGIYLSALAARGRESAPIGARPPVDAIDRLVEDYLRSEVLASTRPGRCRPAAAGIGPRTVSGPLCDEVLGRTGSGVALDRLERSNLFLIPLDARPDMVPLPSPARRPAARGTRPTRPRCRHAGPPPRRCLARGSGPARARPRVRAGGRRYRTCRAARGRLSQATINAGRTETVRRWFGWFETRALWKDYPRLAALATMVFALDGDAARSDRWWTEAGPRRSGRSRLVVTDRRLHPGVPLPGWRRADARRRASTRRGRWSRTSPSGSPRWACWASRHCCEATSTPPRPSMLDGVAHWERGSAANYAAVLCLTHLAGIAIDRGDWTVAATQTKRARSIAMAHGLDEQAAAAAVDAVNARIAFHHGALEQARADATHARRLRTLFSLGGTLDGHPGPARPDPGRPRAGRRRRRPDAARRGPRDPASEPRDGGARRRDGRSGASCRAHPRRRGRRLDADHRRAAAAAAADHAPLVPRDRRAAVRIAEHGQDPGDLDLPQARRDIAQRSGRAGDRHGPARRSGRCEVRHPSTDPAASVSPAPDDARDEPPVVSCGDGHERPAISSEG